MTTNKHEFPFTFGNKDKDYFFLFDILVPNFSEFTFLLKTDYHWSFS